MVDDEDRCYRAVCSRDARFDGCFFTAVLSTGIYCRPSCPATTPRREHVRFYRSAAAAQLGGFRACKRCRPDAAPGSPDWDRRGDLAGRAVRLIADGVVERCGVPGLAHHLAVSERHLHRVLLAEVGAGALALARAQRATTARILAETTDLPFAQVAFASGFSSIRQFNDTVQAVYAASPTALRHAARRRRTSGRRRPAVGACEPLDRPSACPGAVTVRLPARPPCDLASLFAFLAVRAVPGVEEVTQEGAYRRVLDLPGGPGLVTLTPGSADQSADQPVVWCTLQLTDLTDLPVAVRRCRRLLDLDADPVAIAEVLTTDPLIGPLVEANPGRRVPGHVDGAELAVRAVLGQQVSVAGARTLTARLVAALGQPVDDPVGGLTHRFPTVDAVAGAPDDLLALPASRRVALRSVAAAIAAGELQLGAGADRRRADAVLRAVPGIGPWTASYVAMRGLGDPDAFLAGDLVVQRAIGHRLGAAGSVTPAAATALAERWRPWRSYAVVHLWASSSTGATSHTSGATGPATEER
jgi:AraC family transcriptional regulator, regulatory protein of adaptative response / DNA-3-methyladenine glycosylase II